MKYTVGIIVISDRASKGERVDECLPAFRDVLPADTYHLAEEAVISDDPSSIEASLKSFVEKGLDLIITSGGTGCGPRDNTPEVTRNLIDRLTPGVDEAIREFSRSRATFAMYSRGVSGVTGKSFIINLPGSPTAVKEVMMFLLPTLEHPLRLISGDITDCREELKE